MANKRHKPEEIVTKLRQVEVLVGQGMARIDAIRQVRIVEQTYYRWRKQYGEIFYTLKEAQIIIEEWRKHYNTKRPHSALGYRPPAPETIVPMVNRPVMH